MENVIQHLFLGCMLIAGAAAILLVSDWQHRSPGRGKIPRVAIFQFCSRPILDVLAPLTTPCLTAAIAAARRTRCSALQERIIVYIRNMRAF